MPGRELPAALAVVNPHRADCSYPDKDLAGVGVAFKLVQAMQMIEKQRVWEDDMDIAALGTISDLVPLVGENRRIVRLGLARMSENPCWGVRALIMAAGLEGRKSIREWSGSSSARA